VGLNSNQTRLYGLAISRAFGDMLHKTMESGVIGKPYTSDKILLPLNASARVILASDGLWDVFKAQEAFELIKDIPGAVQAAKKLVTAAVAKPDCCDNITVIVINL